MSRTEASEKDFGMDLLIAHRFARFRRVVCLQAFYSIRRKRNQPLNRAERSEVSVYDINNSKLFII